MFQYIMNLTQHKVKVMHIGLTKSAIVLAESFVDFKRKAVSQLCLSGWLEVRVYKAEDCEVRCGSSSVLVVKIINRAYSFSGRNVHVVHQG